MLSTRRLILGVGLAALLAPTAALAQAVSGRASARKAGGAPKLVRGRPDRLDFGDGLVVPMDRRAFGTLWEGQDRWITYARGVSGDRLRAMGEAQEAAQVAMKTLMLTLAFRPERMERVEGSGWRPISKDARDLVYGDLVLPGKPLLPVTEGFGAGGMPRMEARGSGSGGFGEAGEPAESPYGAENDFTHALTGFIVMKTEVDLDYVRETARLVPLT
jgi:hypothetical protein